MINSIEFYCGMSREMKALKCSEMCVKTDDMIELVSRLRYAESETDAILSMLRHSEKDAARYRFMRDMSDEVDVSRFFHIEVSERDAEIDEAMQCK